jgi:hypothetical protein
MIFAKQRIIYQTEENFQLIFRKYPKRVKEVNYARIKMYGADMHAQSELLLRA